MMILRAALTVVLALGLLGAPLAAQAQPAGKVWRIGYLSVATVEFDKSWAASFRQGLRELGYVEGQNVVIDERHADGRPERLPEMAMDMLHRNVDFIVMYGAWIVAKKLPSTIPIVFTVAPNPVAEGLVMSLAHPGGNITGLSDTHADLLPKRLELLEQVAPSASRVAVLFYSNNPTALLQLKTAQAAAPAQGVTAVGVEIRGPEPEDIGRTLTAIRQNRASAILVIAEPTIGVHTKRIAEFAIQHRLPTIGTVRRWADDGLLLAYGTSFNELWRRAATYVDKILRGAKSGDLPVEQPTKFELVINLKTAKALGLTIPPSLLLRADQMIE
jgi:putative tryptophan/tyrosine transport system substrate-binding protein